MTQGDVDAAMRAAAGGNYGAAIDIAKPLVESGALEAGEVMELYRHLIQWNSHIGAVMECRRLAARAVAFGTEKLGACEPRVLAARSVELFWMCEVGYDALAQHRFPQLIEDVKKVLGNRHDVFWAARVNSAMPAKARGDFREAARIYQQILSDMAGVLPSSDVRVLSVRDSYAQAMFLEGEYEDALRIYGENLAEITQELGGESPLAHEVRYEVARCLYAAGQEKAALKEWSELLTEGEKSRGPRDELVVRVRSLIIAAAVEQGWDGLVVEHCRAFLADAPAHFDDIDIEVFAQILQDCEARLRAQRPRGEGSSSPHAAASELRGRE